MFSKVCFPRYKYHVSLTDQSIKVLINVLMNWDYISIYIYHIILKYIIDVRKGIRIWIMRSEKILSSGYVYMYIYIYLANNPSLSYLLRVLFVYKNFWITFNFSISLHCSSRIRSWCCRNLYDVEPLTRFYFFPIFHRRDRINRM